MSPLDVVAKLICTKGLDIFRIPPLISLDQSAAEVENTIFRYSHTFLRLTIHRTKVIKSDAASRIRCLIRCGFFDGIDHDDVDRPLARRELEAELLLDSGEHRGT